ncbi:hypothetical protein P3W83_37380, partial [Cupriavidus basilensis]|nr:hypothetical protein [Cupriavidus basilensis]
MESSSNGGATQLTALPRREMGSTQLCLLAHRARAFDTHDKGTFFETREPARATPEVVPLGLGGHTPGKYSR